MPTTPKGATEGGAERTDQSAGDHSDLHSAEVRATASRPFGGAVAIIAGIVLLLAIVGFVVYLSR